MGNTRFLVLILLSSVTVSTGNVHKLQQPPRPTRTLGSLFGGGSAKPTPPQQPPPPTQQQQHQQQVQQSEGKGVLSPLVQQGSGVRPLVYQVKYYDRINNVVEYPDSRNFNAIDKAGVVDQVVVGQQQQQHQVLVQGGQGVGVGAGGVFLGKPAGVYNLPPERYYLNPLIPHPGQPTQQPYAQDQVFYTLANIGNTQVLIPCTTNQDQLIYDSTIALNVEPQQPQQTRVVQQQYTPPPQSTAPQPQRTPYIPQQTIQQPLVRDQVIAAAQELSSLNALPGSAIVASNVNTPYTQGSYFYYIIPNTPPQYVEPQQRVQPVVSPYYRYGQTGGVPFVLVNGYPYGYPYQQQVVVPNVPVRSQQQVVAASQQVQGVQVATGGTSAQQQAQVQAQVQQQQQNMKG